MLPGETTQADFSAVVPTPRPTTPWRIVSVRPHDDLRLRVVFVDETTGEVQLRKFLESPIFVGTLFGTIGLSYSRHQIRGLVNAAQLTPLGVSTPIRVPLDFVTTSNTLIAPDVPAEALLRRVDVRQRRVVEAVERMLEVGPARSLNTTPFEYRKGLAVSPRALRPSRRGPLTAFATIPVPDDPDPPCAGDAGACEGEEEP